MKIQVVAAISSDGYLLKMENHINSIEGSKRYGLSSWKEKNDLSLHKLSSLIALLEEKRQLSNTNYLAVATSDMFSLIKGLFLYKIADEMVLYKIPCQKETDIRLPEFPSTKWVLRQEVPLQNGLYCLIYRLIK
jgi:hypothetical protein